MTSARLPLGVTLGVLTLLVASVVTTPRGPGGAAGLPPAAPVPLEARDATALAALTARGVTVTAGWEPTGLLEVDDPWALARGEDGVRPWIDLLPRLRLAYDPAGRLLVEDAAVIADPARCYHLARVVRSIGVGLAPPAGPAIAEQLESWLEPPYFSAVRMPPGSGPCSGRDRSQWGFAIELAEPLPCHVPGRDVLCVTLAKWRYDFAARDVWTSTHRTFDVTDGSRLDDAQLHPGLDVVAFDHLVAEAVCAAGGRCDPIPMREGRIHATRTALAVELSPGEGADRVHGSLRVTVPRRALPTLEG
jgi:hypothetical protein